MRLMAAIVLIVALRAAPAAADELVYVPNSTKKVCQLTGDLDRSNGSATLSRTGQRFGVVGTDLGSSFEHNGQLYFLFGDTVGRPGDRDALAWTRSNDPEKIELQFHKGNDGKWLPITVPEIKQGAFEVPSGGISIAKVMYVAHTTDHAPAKVMGRSVLAASHDDGKTFKLLYELSRDKFINISFLRTDEWVYIFGSGDYRKSSVSLARVKPADIGNRSKIQFCASNNSWSNSEADATPLFKHDAVGEFSVAYVEPLKRYLMLYNSLQPRGIMMRSAQSPAGPWSDGTIIFDPWRDKGYGHFMHISAKSKPKADALADPNRDDEWGGEYGPYIMARYTHGAAGKCTIYYTMSTWNPYQVVVMRSELMLEASK